MHLISRPRRFDLCLLVVFQAPQKEHFEGGTSEARPTRATFAFMSDLRFEVALMQFCQTSILQMGEESNFVHIKALTDALRIPVRIVYLDKTGGASDDALDIRHHDFVPEVAPKAFNFVTSSPLTLLFRPGHYDILYSL